MQLLFELLSVYFNNSQINGGGQNAIDRTILQGLHDLSSNPGGNEAQATSCEMGNVFLSRRYEQSGRVVALAA